MAPRWWLKYTSVEWVFSLASHGFSLSSHGFSLAWSTPTQKWRVNREESSFWKRECFGSHSNAGQRQMNHIFEIGEWNLLNICWQHWTLFRNKRRQQTTSIIWENVRPTIIAIYANTGIWTLLPDVWEVRDMKDILVWLELTSWQHQGFMIQIFVVFNKRLLSVTSRHQVIWFC